MGGVDPELKSEVLTAFVESLARAPTKVLRVLRRVGVTKECAAEFHVRYLSEGYRLMLRRLSQEYSMRMLFDAGLLKVDRSVPGQERAIGIFEPWRLKRIPFLVIPYREGGKIVHLKGRALQDTRKLRRHGIEPEITTGHVLPCWFNIDVLDRLKLNQVAMVRTELDVMACYARNVDAIAYTGLSTFRPDWIGKLKGKQVVLVVDEQRKGDRKLQVVEDLCKLGGVEKLHVLLTPANLVGDPLATFLADSLAFLRGADGLSEDDMKINPEDLPGFDAFDDAIAIEDIERSNIDSDPGVEFTPDETTDPLSPPRLTVDD